MGTPNRHHDRSAGEVLCDMVRKPSPALSEEDAHATGADVALLMATYQSAIKPQLDFLTGYGAIASIRPFVLEHHSLPGRAEWDDFIADHPAEARQQVQLVLSLRLIAYREQDTKEYCMAVYLCRRNSWVLCFAETEGTSVTLVAHTLQLYRYNDLRDLLWSISQLMPGRHVIHRRSRHSTETRWEYIPMRLEESLRNILTATAKDKHRRWKRLDTARKVANKRAAIITAPKNN